MSNRNETKMVVDKKNYIDPDWLLEIRQEAKALFKDIGFPNSRHETWKYLNLDQDLDLERHIKKTPIRRTERDECVSVLFKNNTPECESILANKNDLIITNFRSAYAEHKELIKSSLSKGLLQNPFSYLNTAQFDDGALILVKEGCKVEGPIIIDLQTHVEEERLKGIHTRTLIVLEKGASATVFVQHHSFLDKPEFVNDYFDIVLKEEATLEFILTQEGDQPYRFETIKASIDTKANLNYVSFVNDCLVTRHDMGVDFIGEKAVVNLAGIALLSSESQYFNHLYIDHKVGNCDCSQVFKTILRDKSLSEFSGLVVVAKHAHGTNSTQSNPNLLLSDNARALSRPQLRIDADDVECAHGATMGQLNPEEVFYLESRGLNKSAARALLTFGFAEDIIQRIKQPLIQHECDLILREGLSSYDKHR
ncbi:Fe-S cluster assembly protein SufD [Candidatus Marinamargulisbacteria bacterium SCGC AAA071-K20]|nr:Fe-S cluster assembly protein SufD [Candidatus Marinamargulisbacteria bacterium SCGC AAA071-K20]